MTIKRPLISLFTGAGGLDLGLEQSGFTTIVANELVSEACETLRKNKELCNLKGNELDQFVKRALSQRCFKRLGKKEANSLFERISSRCVKEKYFQESTILEGDIREIASSSFRKYIKDQHLFCIAGGPPCQPFSKAGNRKAIDCSKNGDLFFEFVRVVSDLKPKWFLFENVKGITFTKTDVLYQFCNDCNKDELAPFHIRQDFESFKNQNLCTRCNSTNTEWTIRNEKGGSLKIILNEFEKIGYKCSHKILNAADFGAPQLRERLFLVGSRDGKQFRWPQQTHSKRQELGKQRELFMGNSLKSWVSMQDSLWQGTHPVYGKFDASKAKLWVKNVVRPHNEPVTWSLDRPSPTIGAHQGAKLAFAPFGISEKQLHRQQWTTLGRKQGDTLPVYVEHEYLTDRELLKLQTFPDWWYLHGTRMQRAFQIGNAVPPKLAKAMGEAIILSEA